MKFSAFLFLFITYFISAGAQKQNETLLTTSYGISKTNYKAGDTLDFIINTKIKSGWYLYSSEFLADGPMKFECTIENSNDFTVIDTIRAYKPFAHYDDVWEGEVKLFEDIGQFRIAIVVKKAGSIALKAMVAGQVCNDVCVPVEEKIDIDLSTLLYCDYKAADSAVYKHFEAMGEKK